MDIKKEIKSLLQHAELYKSQGLLNESLEQYVQAGRMLKKHAARIGNKKLLPAVAKRIKDLKAEIARIDASPDMSEVTEKAQNIIKEKFAFAEKEETRDLEGAIALVKFGQFERALREFQQLMGREEFRLDAAKNIIRCHVTLDTLDDAVAQYREWFGNAILSAEELNKLRVFLQSILDKKGVREILPVREPEPAVRPAVVEDQGVMDGEIIMPELVEGEVIGEEISDEEIIDISSVEITLEEGPGKGRTVEYDVSFQSGRVINLLISSSDKALIETLRTGLELKKVHFYSPIAMFNGEGVVFSKSRIESGPKQGDYSLDIQIQHIR